MARVARLRGSGLGLVPFLAYVTVFLLIPTVVVVVGAFREDGRLSTGAFRTLFGSDMAEITLNTVLLALVTAAVGAVVGALVAYVVSTANPDGVVRRLVTSLTGVLAQFGGVMLAFAFIAAVGASGVVTQWLAQLSGGDVNLAGSNWLYSLTGLILVYTYFQIPLMVIVFLPAVDGIRAQWREAAENLGATTWQYWRYVGGPVLLPSFLGCALLLFANGMSAFATAAALVTQGNPILPLQIRTALTSEVVLGHKNIGFAVALEMIIIVAVVMALYALLQRRTSRWLR